MSGGTNSFRPTLGNWQASRDYGDYAPTMSTMSGGNDNFIPTSRNWQTGRGYGHGDYAYNASTTSGGTNNFMPYSRNWQARHDYGDYSPNTSDWNHTQAPLPLSGSASFRVDPGASRGTSYPRQSFQERVITRPFGSAGFPVASQSPIQIPVLDNVMGREVNPSHRQIIWGSPPGFMSQPNTQVRTQEDDSRLNRYEQETALKRLKKEIYDPPPKKINRALCLYYRDEAKNIYKQKQREKENEGKRCAVCLEDFEPKETVMLTPCNHMFHEDCIVPWIKSNGHCPVCRFAICERRREGSSDGNTQVLASDNIVAIELISVIRAMEEAFFWDDAIRR